MSEEKDIREYEKSYDKLRQFTDHVHRQNQKRIRAGLWCLFLIPLVFLVLLFSMQSSKLVYLVLWIVSLFVIAVYLITVEYIDFTMQEKMGELGIKDKDADMEPLMEGGTHKEAFGGRLNRLLEKRKEMLSDFSADYEEEYEKEYREQFAAVDGETKQQSGQYAKTEQAETAKQINKEAGDE